MRLVTDEFRILVENRRVFEVVAWREVKTTERCSGHAGTYGIKKEFHEKSMKIGRPVFRQMNQLNLTLLARIVLWVANTLPKALNKTIKTTQILRTPFHWFARPTEFRS